VEDLNSLQWQQKEMKNFGRKILNGENFNGKY